jgi:hypothetical protein
MHIFGGLKSRDRDLAIEISKFLLRQLHAECDSEDYKENWEKRILSPFTFGYYIGFCKQASYECLNTNSKSYRKKFIQRVFDELKGSCGLIINKYIAATPRVRYAREEKKVLNDDLKMGLEEYIPGVELFCYGRYAGKTDLISYVNRTSSDLQLQETWGSHLNRHGGRILIDMGVAS